ncbi:MAG: PEGA domain-containing protein [Myxococcales bacterium]|nr:PEGA domain-containing protein [Myxococcales bacterium]
MRPRLAMLMLAATSSLAACPKQQTTPPPKPPASRPVAKAPPPPAPGKGRIVIDCTPADAEVTIDGENKGTVSELGKHSGLEVDLGVRRVEVRKRGYQPFRIEIKVGERPEYLRVRLKRARQR